MAWRGGWRPTSSAIATAGDGWPNGATMLPARSVGDRGMVTSQNLDDLRSSGHGYIVGRNRRRSGEVFDYIKRATGPWIECPVGITAREKSTAPKTLVQEVASNEPGVRVFIVHSEE